MRTRLEFLIRSHAVRPADLARRAHYSRAHVARVRDGLIGLPKMEAAVVRALAELTGIAFAAEDVFEPPSLPILDTPRGKRQKSSKDVTFVTYACSAADTEFARALAAARRRAVSEAAVRELLDCAAELLDKAPARAEDLYAAAATAARILPRTPKQLAKALTGFAEKGRANALRMQGSYPAALAAAEWAVGEFEAATYCERELGLARFCRAAILFKMERFTDAERELATARRLLERQHDRASVLKCDFVRACILVERGNLDEARTIFLAQRRIAEARREEHRLADLWMNLVVCDLRRNADIAAHWLDRAIRKYRELGMPSEVTRARWIGASVLLAKGDRPAALRQLRSAARGFRALGMFADAGFVELDLLAELTADRQWKRAEPIARDLVDLFSRTGNAGRAAVALTYLREAVHGRVATSDTIAHVKRFLQKLDVYPDIQFTPNEEPA